MYFQWKMLEKGMKRNVTLKKRKLTDRAWNKKSATRRKSVKGQRGLGLADPQPGKEQHKDTSEESNCGRRKGVPGNAYGLSKRKSRSPQTPRTVRGRDQPGPSS